MRNVDHVIFTKSIRKIYMYVGMVKHINIISLKGWIFATVINFNRQIQGLLFSFDCQPPALHWLRQQFHVVFCIFAFFVPPVFFFKASNSMSYFCDKQRSIRSKRCLQVLVNSSGKSWKNPDMSLIILFASIDWMWSLTVHVEGLPALLFERKPFEKGKLGGV